MLVISALSKNKLPRHRFSFIQHPFDDVAKSCNEVFMDKDLQNPKSAVIMICRSKIFIPTK